MINQFGSRVVGKEAAEAAHRVAEKAGDIFGKRVTGHQPLYGNRVEAEPETLQRDSVVDAVAQQATEDLEELLAVSSAQAAAQILAAERLGQERQGILDAAQSRIDAFAEILGAPAADEPSGPAGGSATPEPVDFTGASAKDIIATLAEQPELAEQVLDAEMARDAPPRVTVLRAVLAVEEARDDTRPGLIEEIKAALGS